MFGWMIYHLDFLRTLILRHGRNGSSQILKFSVILAVVEKVDNLLSPCMF